MSCFGIFFFSFIHKNVGRGKIFMNEKKRVLWIDVARGIAILLAVFGHCIGKLFNPGNRFILAFHMPLFFFLSGMCISESIISAKNYLVKKVKTLLVPQAVLGILNFILNRGKKTTSSHGS